MLYRSVYRTPYRYAPFAFRYSIRHSSTLPPCFQAAKPVPGLPAVRPWLYCRCPPHQGADQGLCSGFSGLALALCCLPSSPVTLRSWPLVKACCICRRWVCINQFANVPAAGSYAYIRRTSDRLCKEHGLSVVTSQLYRCRKVERPRT